MLHQNKILQGKAYRLFYQSFVCPKTNFRSLVKEREIDQLLMNRLQEAIKEPHNIISDLAGSSLILSHCHKSLKKS